VGTVAGNDVTSRTCVPSCSEDDSSFGNLMGARNYCCNNEDLCNGAVKPAAQLLPAAVALIVGIAVAAARLL